MKCWKCGKECEDFAVNCPDCGVSLSRKTPETEIGRAMRMLYDRYGAEKVLTNSAYLVNGLGDLTDGTKKIRNQLNMAMDAGLGRMYLDQVHMGGPDASFNERVHKLLTEEAGLNDKAADELAGYFDEMIGWNGAKKEPDHNYGPEIDRKKSTDDYGKEIERKKPKDNQYEKPQNQKRGGKGLLLVALCAVVIGVLVLTNQKKNDQPEKQETTAESTMTAEADETAANEEARKAEEEKKTEEEKKVAEEEKEQKELKERFEAMRDHRGDLVEDDFIIYSEKDNKYSSMYSNGMAFGYEEGIVLARGARAGDSIETVKELYGDPDWDFSITEDNSTLYNLYIFEYQDEERAADILGDEAYEYELRTEEMKYSIGFRFDKDTEELEEIYFVNSKD